MCFLVCFRCLKWTKGNKVKGICWWDEHQVEQKTRSTLVCSTHQLAVQPWAKQAVFPVARSLSEEEGFILRSQGLLCVSISLFVSVFAFFPFLLSLILRSHGCQFHESVRQVFTGCLPVHKGAVLSAGRRVVNRTDKSPLLMGLISFMGKTDNNQLLKVKYAIY